MTDRYPFRMAVISDEVSQDPRRIVAFAKAFGLSAIEIRSLWDGPPQALTRDRIHELKHILDDAGLKTCSIASPFLKCDFNDGVQFQAHLEILRKCLDLANALETDFIRGFTFWRKEELARDIAPLLDGFQEVIPILEGTGKFLLIENEASTNTATGKETADFLRRIDHSQIRGIWDPANGIYSPAPEKPFPNGYQWIKAWAPHVHVKDAVKPAGQEPRCVPIGEGEVDWPGQFKALLEDGYTGYLSLETHWRAAERLSNEELELPGGMKFSEGGEYASGICMNNIRSIFEQLRGSSFDRCSLGGEWK